MKWSTQILSWAATLIIARLVGPAGYGLFGMAMVYLGFIALVNEFGLGTAIVQRRDLTSDQIARLGGLSVLLGVFFCALSLAVSGPVAHFYGEPAVQWIIRVLSITFITSSLQVLPRGLLARDLRFSQLAWLDGIQVLSLTSGTLLLAALGLQYRALVFGALASSAIVTAVALLWRGHRVSWPRAFGSIAGLARFGWHVVVSRVAWYAYGNADLAIVGRVFGKSPLGAYSFGRALALVPMERISGLVGQVAPGVFAACQHDRLALRRYFLAMTEALALATLPAALGLALVADDFVLLVLGEEWRSAIMPLRLLAVYAAYRSLDGIPPHILIATGHARANMYFSLLAAAILPPAFYAGAQWGVSGVAAVWVVVYPAVSLPMYVYVFRLLDATWGHFGRALWPAASGSLAMVFVLLTLRLALPPDTPLVLRFALQVLAGAATYAAAVYVLHRGRLETFWGLIRHLRS